MKIIVMQLFYRDTWVELTIRGVICVWTVMFGGSTLFGAVNVSRNGLIWPATFEGDSLPQTSNPAWSVFDSNGFATVGSDGNIYSTTSGSVGVTSSFEFAGPTWNSGSSVRTVEFRARVPSATAQAADGAASFVVGINNTAFDLRLFTDRLAFNGNGGLNAPANQIPLDLTDFQTLRVIVNPSASPRFSLFLNQAQSPIFTSNDHWFTSPGFDKIVFGDISAGGVSGTSQWDYISWNSTGAFPPTPTGQRTWAVNSSGDWHLAQNWAEGEIPNSANSVAVLGGVLSRPRTVFMNTPTILRGARMASEFAYTVAGQGSLQFSNAEGSSFVEVEGGTAATAHQFQVPVQFTGDANINVGLGAQLTFNNSIEFAGATLTKSGAGVLRINNRLGTGVGQLQVNAGTVDGSGRIAGSLQLGTGAILSPGDGVGKMTIAGNYTQAPGGSLNIEIGGAQSGRHDVLEVLGGIALNGGSLSVSLRDGFVPLPGDTFAILQFASLSGSFNAINLPVGVSWDTSNLLSNGILAVSAFRSGDYNQNGAVDAADYTVWRDSLGSSVNLAADGNGNGTVDAGDYNVWKTSFGASSSVFTTSVPEPTTCFLFILTTIVLTIPSRLSLTRPAAISLRFSACRK